MRIEINWEQHRKRISTQIQQAIQKIEDCSVYTIHGRIISAIGVVLNAYLPNAKIGDLCKIYAKDTKFELYAEVVAIDGYTVKLLPYGNIENISHNCRVYLLQDSFKIRVGQFLLGKIVDGFGHVIDSLVGNDEEIPINNNGIDVPIYSKAPDPLLRPLISEPLVTGIKSIDLFTTCGVGQRIGVFAGPGMGKTTLMGMMIRNVKADIVVIALIGERGREVREFIDLELSEDIRARCVLIVSTSDRPPVEQVKSAYIAQTIAEYFRDQGKRVALFVDSITRFARAQREIGLAAGEPIARGSYPPSVFMAFPRLMERAGNNINGSISAFYSVLMEGEDFSQDPVADEVKSIIDGHIILSKKLAEVGHFPSVDLATSLSRIADRIISPEHLKAARHVRLLLSRYKELEFLIRVGEYQPGQDSLADEAVSKNDLIINLLKQSPQENLEFNNIVQQLLNIVKK